MILININININIIIIIIITFITTIAIITRILLRPIPLLTLWMLEGLTPAQS